MVNDPFGGLGDLQPGPTEKLAEVVVTEEAKVAKEVVEAKVEEAVKKEMSYVEKVLHEHNQIESNIPINHPYWGIRGTS